MKNRKVKTKTGPKPKKKTGKVGKDDEDNLSPFQESATFGNRRTAGTNSYRHDDEYTDDDLYETGQDIPHFAIKTVHLRVDMPGSWDSMYNALSTTIRCRDALSRYDVNVNLTIHKFSEVAVRPGSKIDFHGLVKGRLADPAYETVVLALQEQGSILADQRSAEEVLLAWSPPKQVNIVMHPETMMGPLALIYIINTTIQTTSEHVNDFMGSGDLDKYGEKQYWPTLNYGQQMLVRPSVDVSMLLFTEFVNLSHWTVWMTCSWFLECLPARITPRAYNGVEGNCVIARWGPFRSQDRTDPDGKSLEEAISSDEAIVSAKSAELWSTMKRLQKKISDMAGKSTDTTGADGGVRMDRLTRDLKDARVELIEELKRQRKSHFGKRCIDYKQGHYHGGMVEGCKYSPYVHLEVTMANRGRRRTIAMNLHDSDLLLPRKPTPDRKEDSDIVKEVLESTPAKAGDESVSDGNAAEEVEEADKDESDEDGNREESTSQEGRHTQRVRYETRPYVLTRMREPDSPMKLVNECDMWEMNTVSWRKRTLIFVVLVTMAMLSVMYFISSGVVWSTQKGSLGTVSEFIRDIKSFRDFGRVLAIMLIPMSFLATYIGMTLNVLLYHFEIRLLPRSSGARGARTRTSAFFNKWLGNGREILLFISYFLFPLFGAVLTIFAFIYRRWGRVVTLVFGGISIIIAYWAAQTIVALVLSVLIALSCQRVWTWTKNQTRKRIHNMVGFLRKRRTGTK